MHGSDKIFAEIKVTNKNDFVMRAELDFEMSRRCNWEYALTKL